MSMTLKTTFTFDDDTTRQYAFSVADSLATACKSKIKAINTSLAGGTDNGLGDFFLSDGGDPLVKISAAQLISETETELDLGGN